MKDVQYAATQVDQQKSQLLLESQLLSEFLKSAEAYFSADLSRIYQSLRRIIPLSSLEKESLGCASQFLQMFPHKREESVSSKIAWIFEADFLPQEIKPAFQKKLITKCCSLLCFDPCTPNKSKITDQWYNSIHEISKVKTEDRHFRSEAKDKKNRRSDIVLFCGEKHVVGIEVKIGDKDFEKSEEAFNQLINKYKERYENHGYFILMPAPSEELPVGSWPSNVPYLTWENFLNSIRAAYSETAGLSQFAQFLLELFVVSAENSVLGFDHTLIRNALQEKQTGSAVVTSAHLQSYLNYRKAGVINNVK
jgi:hypothetical protein